LKFILNTQYNRVGKKEEGGIRSSEVFAYKSNYRHMNVCGNAFGVVSVFQFPYILQPSILLVQNGWQLLKVLSRRMEVTTPQSLAHLGLDSPCNKVKCVSPTICIFMDFDHRLVEL